MAGSGSWPRIAVVGAGAVGGYFGGLLARAGAPVILIGRRAFVERVKSDGLVLDTLSFSDTVPVEASTDLSAARDAEVVLFSVKATDTEAVARELAGYIAPKTLVVSLQNGVDNVERIRAVAHINAFPAVVYVAASVPEVGRIKHAGRGDLVIGPASEQTEMLAALCSRAGIPCRISENIRGELWTKLLWNCALNAVSALGRSRYRQIAESASGRCLVKEAVSEVLAVARAEQIVMPGVSDLNSAMDGAMQIATQMADAFSSTAQDLQAGKRTEIDSLNGYIARRGQELEVSTPVNYALYALVKLAENAAGGN